MILAAPEGCDGTCGVRVGRTVPGAGSELQLSSVSMEPPCLQLPQPSLGGEAARAGVADCAISGTIKRHKVQMGSWPGPCNWGARQTHALVQCLPEMVEYES